MKIAQTAKTMINVVHGIMRTFPNCTGCLARHEDSTNSAKNRPNKTEVVVRSKRTALTLIGQFAPALCYHDQSYPKKMA
jgi:hypothetical protein